MILTLSVDIMQHIAVAFGYTWVDIIGIEIQEPALALRVQSGRHYRSHKVRSLSPTCHIAQCECHYLRVTVDFSVQNVQVNYTIGCGYFYDTLCGEGDDSLGVEVTDNLHSMANSVS